jgi:site-specific recombinase XerD
MCRPVGKRTVNTYSGHLRTLFLWIVAEGGIPSSPMGTLAVPVSRTNQVNSFTDAQIEALLSAA